jgi:hypothetical protein
LHGGGRCGRMRKAEVRELSFARGGFPWDNLPIVCFDWIKSSDQMRLVRRKARKFSMRVYIFIHHTGGGMMGTGPWASGRGWPCCRCFRLRKDCDTHLVLDHGVDWLCFVQASWIPSVASCQPTNERRASWAPFYEPIELSDPPVHPTQRFGYVRDFRALTLGDEKGKINRRRNAKTPQLVSSNMHSHGSEGIIEFLKHFPYLPRQHKELSISYLNGRDSKRRL